MHPCQQWCQHKISIEKHEFEYEMTSHWLHHDIDLIMKFYWEPWMWIWNDITFDLIMIIQYTICIKLMGILFWLILKTQKTNKFYWEPWMWIWNDITFDLIMIIQYTICIYGNFILTNFRLSNNQFEVR